MFDFFLKNIKNCQKKLLFLLTYVSCFILNFLFSNGHIKLIFEDLAFLYSNQSDSLYKSFTLQVVRSFLWYICTQFLETRTLLNVDN